jgi:hypothetical protein
MLPIYANYRRGVAKGYSYGFLVTPDILGISWRESHKKQTKYAFHVVLRPLERFIS